jgi:hypothetical protein
VIAAENGSIFAVLVVVVLAGRIALLTTGSKRVVPDRTPATLPDNLRFELNQRHAVFKLVIPILP